MATRNNVPIATITLLTVTLIVTSVFPTGAHIGVCNGLWGDDLPSRQKMVDLYKSNGIGLMRIYSPDIGTLKALQGSDIQLILGAPNDNLQNLAQNPSQATRWVRTNVKPYASNIRYIAVGNEVQHQHKPFVGPAMQNIQNALNAANLGRHIKVSTALDFSFLTKDFPPSTVKFNDLSFIRPVVKFLKENRSPLMVNIYPYFKYINHKQDISLDYALFNNGPTNTAIDHNTGLRYQNLFDALVDSVYAALANVGGPNIPIVVSESGWPSHGGDSATPENAETYYKKLINHVKNGSPKKQGPLETYLFAMFDENQKPGIETERHFGLFFPNEKRKYGKLEFN